MFTDQINPNQVLELGLLSQSDSSFIRQVGIDVRINEDIVIPCCRCCNCTFVEQICCPPLVRAHVFIRSSYARMGILQTSGVYDPGYGWDGSLYSMQIESVNDDDQLYKEWDKLITYLTYAPHNGPRKYAPAGCTLVNMGDKDLTIPQNTPIAQIIFYKSNPATIYSGYYNSTTSVESKLYAEAIVDQLT